jgi:hypothetical protein
MHYNGRKEDIMKNVQSLFVVSFFLVSSVFARSVDIAEDGVDVTVLSSNNSRTVIEYTIGEFAQLPVEINGKLHYQLRLGEEPLTFEKGYPELPHVPRSIVIPNSGEMEVSVQWSDFTDYPMAVAPSKGLIDRSLDPWEVPYGFSSVYETDGFYPQNIVELGTPYILRDFRGIVVTVYPFQYNPVQRILRVYTKLTIEVKESGGETENIKFRNTARVNEKFSRIYDNHFINLDGGRYTPVEEKGRMIVISHADFMGAIQPYVDWKNQKGIQTDLYDVATIGADTTSIKNFILSQYNQNDGLVFVQLVGGAQYVPSCVTDSVFWQIQGCSDSRYSLVEGSDAYPDLFVGRFSAQSVEDVETQVERTIWYERDIVDGDWLHIGTGIGTLWGEGQGYNGWNGKQSLEVIRGKLLTYNYTWIDTLYEIFVPPYYFLPVEAESVTAVLREGRSIVNVDGNADTIYLDTGQYIKEHIDSLNNDGMLPFIYLAAPWCGRFSGVCLAENWLWATNDATGNPTGAIAVYTCSNALAYAPPQASMHETVDLLIGDEMNSYGGLMYNGMCFMMDIYGAPDQYHTFENFNILGDVSFQVRTDTPVAMPVSHDTIIQPGQTTFDVMTGTQEALVCLSYNYQIIDAGYTDTSGAITLDITGAPPASEYILTITGYNKITYIDTITVLGIEQETDPRPFVTRLFKHYPDPFRKSTTISFELSRSEKVTVEVYNCIGQRVRTLVEGKMDAGRQTVVWNTLDRFGHPVPSGVYFYRLVTPDYESVKKMHLIR